MQFSAKFRYACFAMLELARNESSGEPLRLKRITERHRIPHQFLVQILQDLKRAGLVLSTRGASGGYRLAMPAPDITLACVFEAVEGVRPRSSEADHNSPFAAPIASIDSEIWEFQCDRLRERSLANVLQESLAAEVPMWYI